MKILRTNLEFSTLGKRPAEKTTGVTLKQLPKEWWNQELLRCNIRRVYQNDSLDFLFLN